MHTTTQLEAYSRVLNATGTIKHEILRLLEQHPRGLIQDEIVERINSNRKRFPYKDGSIQTRVSELVDLGIVVDTGNTRAAPTGYDQIIWRLRRNDEPFTPRVRHVCPTCGRRTK